MEVTCVGRRNLARGVEENRDIDISDPRIRISSVYEPDENCHHRLQDVQ